MEEIIKDLEEEVREIREKIKAQYELINTINKIIDKWEQDKNTQKDT